MIVVACPDIAKVEDQRSVGYSFPISHISLLNCKECKTCFIVHFIPSDISTVKSVESVFLLKMVWKFTWWHILQSCGWSRYKKKTKEAHIHLGGRLEQSSYIQRQSANSKGSSGNPKCNAANTQAGSPLPFQTPVSSAHTPCNLHHLPPSSHGTILPPSNRWIIQIVNLFYY